MKTATIKVKNIKTGAETQTTVAIRTKRGIIEAAKAARQLGGKLMHYSDVSGTDYEAESGLNPNWRNKRNK